MRIQKFNSTDISLRLAMKIVVPRCEQHSKFGNAAFNYRTNTNVGNNSTFVVSVVDWRSPPDTLVF